MKIYTKQEVCELLSIKPRCLEGMVAKLKFPHPARIGKANYWTEEAIHAWHKELFMSQINWRHGQPRQEKPTAKTA